MRALKEASMFERLETLPPDPILGLSVAFREDRSPDKVDLSELVQAEPLLGDAGVALLQPGVSVQQRSTPGGAGPVPVTVQREQLRERVAGERARSSVND